MIPKFRVWIKTKKRMVETNDILSIDYEYEEVETQFIDGLPDDRDLESFLFKDVILMQSTGLKDKNGKEIFEGDVISTYTDNLVIKRDNLLGFYVELDEERNHFAETVDIEYLDLFAKDFGAAVQIIGNIYENPELLEEKE